MSHPVGKITNYGDLETYLDANPNLKETYNVDITKAIKEGREAWTNEKITRVVITVLGALVFGGGATMLVLMLPGLNVIPLTFTYAALITTAGSKVLLGVGIALAATGGGVAIIGNLLIARNIRELRAAIDANAAKELSTEILAYMAVDNSDQGPAAFLEKIDDQSFCLLLKEFQRVYVEPTQQEIKTVLEIGLSDDLPAELSDEQQRMLGAAVFELTGENKSKWEKILNAYSSDNNITRVHQKANLDGSAFIPPAGGIEAVEPAYTIGNRCLRQIYDCYINRIISANIVGEEPNLEVIPRKFVESLQKMSLPEIELFMKRLGAIDSRVHKSTILKMCEVVSALQPNTVAFTHFIKEYQDLLIEHIEYKVYANPDFINDPFITRIFASIDDDKKAEFLDRMFPSEPLSRDDVQIGYTKLFFKLLESLPDAQAASFTQMIEAKGYIPVLATLTENEGLLRIYNFIRENQTNPESIKTFLAAVSLKERKSIDFINTILNAHKTLNVLPSPAICIHTDAIAVFYGKESRETPEAKNFYMGLCAMLSNEQLKAVIDVFDRANHGDGILSQEFIKAYLEYHKSKATEPQNMVLGYAKLISEMWTPLHDSAYLISLFNAMGADQKNALLLQLQQDTRLTDFLVDYLQKGKIPKDNMKTLAQYPLELGQAISWIPQDKLSHSINEVIPLINIQQFLNALFPDPQYTSDSAFNENNNFHALILSLIVYLASRDQKDDNLLFKIHGHLPNLFGGALSMLSTNPDAFLKAFSSLDQDSERAFIQGLEKDEIVKILRKFEELSKLEVFQKNLGLFFSGQLELAYEVKVHMESNKLVNDNDAVHKELLAMTNSVAQKKRSELSVRLGEELQKSNQGQLHQLAELLKQRETLFMEFKNIDRKTLIVIFDQMSPEMAKEYLVTNSGYVDTMMATFIKGFNEENSIECRVLKALITGPLIGDQKLFEKVVLQLKEIAKAKTDKELSAMNVDLKAAIKVVAQDKRFKSYYNESVRQTFGRAVNRTEEVKWKNFYDIAGEKPDSNPVSQVAPQQGTSGNGKEEVKAP